MRDKAKKYLLDTYLADWAPKPVESQATIRPTTLQPPRAQKVVRKGFLEDTDDEDKEDEDDT